jgi:hypothetical protein
MLKGDEIRPALIKVVEDWLRYVTEEKGSSLIKERTFI